MNRCSPFAVDDEKKQTAEHREIRAGVAHHVPESLIGAKQLWDFRSADRGGNNDQQWNGGKPCF